MTNLKEKLESALIIGLFYLLLIGSVLIITTQNELQNKSYNGLNNITQTK